MCTCTFPNGKNVLAVRHGVRFSLGLVMQKTRIVVAVLFALLAFAAEAAPRKKGNAAQAKKAPVAAPVKGPAPSRPSAPEDVPSASADASAPGAPPTRGPTRIDFDDRLIQGQTNKSGAVYLYDRKELKIRSMIKKRDNFREEIVSSLYDN